jgi:hypothetical protein
MYGLRVSRRVPLLSPPGARNLTRCSSNKAQDFWKDIAEKYFPALPPLQHVPEKNTYIPKDEGEERGAYRLPGLKYPQMSLLPLFSARILNIPQHLTLLKNIFFWHIYSLPPFKNK